MENATETKTANKPEQSAWEKFKIFIPYLSVFVITLGLVYEGLYYWCFNIDIQDYVGVSELLLTISKIAVYVVALVIAFFVLARFQEKVHIADEAKKANNNNENEKNVASNASAILFTIVWVVVMIIFVIVATVFFVYTWLVLIFYLGGYALVAFLTTFYYKKYTGKYLNQDKVAMLVTTSVLITVFVVTRAFIQAKMTEKGEYLGTKIYTTDSTYVSDSTHFFIGKTTGYYFMYDKDKKYTTVIPERDVTRFEIKENKVTLK